MGCDDNGQNGGCRLSDEQINTLADAITNSLSNTPIRTTVKLEGKVPLNDKPGGPVVGTTSTSVNDMFEKPGMFDDGPPVLNKEKLKDFLCDLVKRAEEDPGFKNRYKNSDKFPIVIRLLVAPKGIVLLPVIPYPSVPNIHRPIEGTP